MGQQQQNVALSQNNQNAFQDLTDYPNPVTVVGHNNATGATFQRGFASMAMCQQWLATDANSLGITVDYVTTGG